MPTFHIHHGEALAVLQEMPAESAHCCVTSPPYWGLRDYGVAGQLGLERTPEEYVAGMVAVFSEVRRVLRDDGTLWLNLGDSYAAGGNGTSPRYQEMRGEATALAQALPRKIAPDGLKPKDLVGIPWRVAFALQADGWYLRSDIIWHKPNPMPESVTDRPTKAHEYIFLLSKNEQYYFDGDAIAEPAIMAPGKSGFGGPKLNNEHKAHTNKIGKCWEKKETRSRRSVWTVATHPFPEAHFATFPPALVEPCIKAGCPEGGTVLDPFNGAGTTGMVACRWGRNYVGIELNPEYIEMARLRILNDAPMFNEEAHEASRQG